MKKSVKKVLAALLSVLLFASLFTTTAFAEGTLADTVANLASEVKETSGWVAFEKNYLNDCVKGFYGVPKAVAEKYNIGDLGDLGAVINWCGLASAQIITNSYTAAAYHSIHLHVEEATKGLTQAYTNMYDNAIALVNNVVNNLVP